MINHRFKQVFAKKSLILNWLTEPLFSPKPQARNLQKKYKVKWIWEKFYFYLVLAEEADDLRDLQEPLEDPKSKWDVLESKDFTFLLINRLLSPRLAVRENCLMHCNTLDEVWMGNSTKR